MQLAVRSYLTAGVAMVGATAIIASPISVAPQDVKVPAIYSSQVALTAGFDPITPYVNFFNDVGKNIGLISQAMLEQPAPILSQIVANQIANVELVSTILQQSVNGAAGWATTVPGTVQLAVENLMAGNYRDGIYPVWALPNSFLISAAFPLMGLLQIYTTLTQNIANATAQLPTIATLVGLAAVNLYSQPGHVGRFVLDPIADAVEAGDIATAVSIALSSPAIMADRIINKSLLSSSASGLVTNLLVRVPRMIAAAITPPAPEPEPGLVNRVASLPSAGAQTVSLKIGSTAPEATAGQTPAVETSGEATQPTPAGQTGTVTEETPATEALATEVADKTEGTEDSEKATGTDDSTGSEDSSGTDADTGPKVKSRNGATTLRGGIKARPGTTGSATGSKVKACNGATTLRGGNKAQPGTSSGSTQNHTGADSKKSGNNAGSPSHDSDGSSDS